MATRASIRGGRAVLVGSVFVCITALMVVLIEGTASILLVFYDVALRDVPTANQYDATLGWTGRRNIKLVDFYGRHPLPSDPDRSRRGGTVINNSRGFRSEVEFEDSLPKGARRVICSGDSFTFGAGVGNGETWCDLLQEFDPRLESINMGISGYGIGQAMLRYEQSVGNLEHTLHVFAFISSNFGRSVLPNHHGYGRPIMRIKDGDLVVDNVPVPRFRNSMARYAQKTIEELRMAEFARRLMRRLAQPTERNPQEQIENVSAVSRKILLRVDELTAGHGARSVFVYLPIEQDFRGPDVWESWVVDMMGDLDLAFINLADDLRTVPQHLVSSYFIPRGVPGQTHYSRSGNRWIAAVLYRHLLEGGLLPAPLSDKGT